MVGFRYIIRCNQHIIDIKLQTYICIVILHLVVGTHIIYAYVEFLSNNKSIRIVCTTVLETTSAHIEASSTNRHVLLFPSLQNLQVDAYNYALLSLHAKRLFSHLFSQLRIVGSNDDNELDGSMLYNRWEDVIIINALNLVVAFGNETCFVSCYVSIYYAFFSSENPHATYDIFPFRRMNKCPNLVLLKKLHLSFHGSNPICKSGNVKTCE